MLAAEETHRELLHHLAMALRLLGSSLLPDLGVHPVPAMMAAKPETRELVSLLALIASCPPAVSAAPRTSTTFAQTCPHDPVFECDLWATPAGTLPSKEETLAVDAHASADVERTKFSGESNRGGIDANSSDIKRTSSAGDLGSNLNSMPLPAKQFVFHVGTGIIPKDTRARAQV